MVEKDFVLDDVVLVECEKNDSGKRLKNASVLESYEKQVKIISSHKPFLSELELNDAFEKLEKYAQAKLIILIAKIAVCTGASLDEILDIKEDDVYFYCSKTKEKYIMPDKELYIKSSSDKSDNYYFSVSGVRPNHSTISSYFNQVTKRAGEDLSFLRFNRTYYYKAFLTNKSPRFIPYFNGMSINKIREVIGISAESYDEIINNEEIKWEYNDSSSYVFIVGASKMASELVNLYYKEKLNGKEKDKIRRIIYIGDDQCDDKKLKIKFKRVNDDSLSYAYNGNVSKVIKRYLPSDRCYAIVIVCALERIQVGLIDFQNMHVLNVDKAGNIEFVAKKNSRIHGHNTCNEIHDERFDRMVLNPYQDKVSDETQIAFKESLKYLKKYHLK